MRTIGIICEYNPFHNGHLRQFRLARERAGEKSALVCLMSGNYVQRGEPALFPKRLRAEAAVRCGADLVLELPLTVALSSAEGFAAGGVRILSALGCEFLCYGIESEDHNKIMSTARANLDPAFDVLLRRELKSGCSYPTARQRALEALGAGAGLSSPNDILAVEYCKAILRQQSALQSLPIRRPDSYHADSLDPEAPSASALRQSFGRQGQGLPQQAMGREASWHCAVPTVLHDLYEGAPIHTLQAGERAVLALLRSLPDEAFAALPYGSEGLWSKFRKACRACTGVEEILEATKSKRYARTRIQRMLLCACLGLCKQDLESPPPYARILAFNQTGRALLREMKSRFPLVHAGEVPEDAAYYALECRAAALYSLFSAEDLCSAAEEAGQRVFVAETF